MHFTDEMRKNVIQFLKLVQNDVHGLVMRDLK